MAAGNLLKTSGIHFFYKNRSIRPFELANVDKNTFHNTSTVQIAKNHANFFETHVTHSVGHLDVLWRENFEIQTAVQ